jgi:hypothetical protein
VQAHVHPTRCCSFFSTRNFFKLSVDGCRGEISQSLAERLIDLPLQTVAKRFNSSQKWYSDDPSSAVLAAFGGDHPTFSSFQGTVLLSFLKPPKLTSTYEFCPDSVLAMMKEAEAELKLPDWSRHSEGAASIA